MEEETHVALCQGLPSFAKVAQVVRPAVIDVTDGEENEGILSNLYNDYPMIWLWPVQVYANVQ